MTNLIQRTLAAITVFSLATAGLIAGCGGGGGGLSSQVVSGTAAVGAPLSGQVSLKDSSATPQTRTTVIGSDGSFAIDVTGMQAPFILEATGSAAGTSYKLHSFAESTGTANINPLSDAIVASAAGDTDASKSYDSADHDKLGKIKGNLAATVDALLKKLQPLLQQYNAQNTNPITSRYIANHLDLDDMFDNVKITVANGVLSIVNAKTGAVIYSGKVTDIANGNFYPDNVPSTPAAPVAPTGVAAVGGAGQATISWTAVSNATSYNIYYATTSGVTTATGTKIANATTPYVQTGLSASTTYYYVVTAVNSTGESVASAQASATTNAAVPTPTAPAAPTGVTATGGTKQVTISWPAVTGATSYNIYYATTSGVSKTNGTKITGATSPAVQTGLADATTYYYVVTAVNSTGESAASVQVAATTLAAVPAPTAPAAPTGVTATGGAKQATISWSAVSGATSYNIYYATTSGVSKTNGTKIAGATSPYVQTALSAGTTYYYIVTAVNSVGESTASAQASATTNAAPPAVPTAPTGVTATGGTNQMTVSWSAVSGATSYNIYWSTATGVTIASGTKIAGATSPYVQTGLAAGTAYYYIVTAVNSSGESPASAQASASTSAPAPVVPAAPTGVGATGGTNQVTVSWSAVSGATSYNIYYATTSGVSKTSGTKITGATSPYVQTGLTAGTTYYYIVTAVNSAGESAASAQASAATTAAATCGSCHAIPPATGQHSFHIGLGYTCLTCHGTGYSSTTVNAATHANGTVNVVTSLNWNGTSCSPACHGTRNW
ncbi:fibronectin type III domain-containing protein [Geobacter sp. FeAm09]|uniref:fibronectin type III domain-containing protein n=1 Tax=Geobacter sp. FeAm09 TaxID=2597769 RepID=UPI00143D406F|nr:fibronectin type III domain-containing protein [Geobacter sp. FeAm09]